MPKTLAVLLFMMWFLAIGVQVRAQDPAWSEITPGGDAVCARGTPYTFYVRGGDPSKLLIYFQGGGACWNDATCAPEAGLFDEVIVGNEVSNYTNGIFDSGNGENPLASYSTVFVTYCTGDYHTGNRAVDYTTGTVQHRGAVNAGAALRWAYATIPRPSEVVIAGCSAGGIGAIYHTRAIASQYSSARITQFGDAGVGVIPPTWGGFDVWGTRRNSAPNQFVTSLYSATARGRVRAAQFTTVEDNVQTTYYTIMGAVNAWTLEMSDALSRLEGRANFRSYIAPGGEHCIAETPRFYGENVSGVRFRDWFATLISGGALPGNVR